MSNWNRPYSLIKFSDQHLPQAQQGQYPFKYDHTYVYFGEIPNMRKHCVVMDHTTGQMYSGYHMDLFTEIDEDGEIR